MPLLNVIYMILAHTEVMTLTTDAIVKRDMPDNDSTKNRITVVVPNYNGMKFVKDCFDSLFSQDEDTESFRVLMIDNGSQDESVEFVRTNYPLAEIVKMGENTGFCKAVNEGIKRSETPYVILLNNDTKVESGFVKGLVKAIDKEKQIFAASAMMKDWKDNSLLDDAGDRYSLLGWAFARGKGKRCKDYTKPCNIFAACGGAAIYRKEIFDRIGLFDENHFAYLEDIDVCYRAKINGYKCVYAPEAGVIHFGSGTFGARYTEKKVILSASNNIYMAYKNMPLLQLIINLPFLFMGCLIKFLFFVKKGFGKSYLKGIKEGFKKAFSKEGREKKVRFKPGNLVNYIKIEAEMIAALFQILKKN